MRVATPDYFRTLGIPLVKGRSILESDTKDSAQIALVSQSLARKRWGDQDPLGAQNHL